MKINIQYTKQIMFFGKTVAKQLAQQHANANTIAISSSQRKAF